MTEKMKNRLADLKARQKAGEHMRCPRCGADTMKEPVYTNALSRIADIYICDACGSAEAMLAFMKQQYPLTSWWAFQPERPESDFRELPAVDVLMRVQLEQIGMLTDICTKCMNDPEHAAEYRLEAFGSCPGLTEHGLFLLLVYLEAAPQGMVFIALRGQKVNACLCQTGALFQSCSRPTYLG